MARHGSSLGPNTIAHQRGIQPAEPLVRLTRDLEGQQVSEAGGANLWHAAVRELLGGWVADHDAVVDVEGFVDGFELEVCAVFGCVEPVGLETASPDLFAGWEAVDVVEGCDLLWCQKACAVRVQATEELGHQGVEQRRPVAI